MLLSLRANSGGDRLSKHVALLVQFKFSHVDFIDVRRVCLDNEHQKLKLSSRALFKLVFIKYILVWRRLILQRYSNRYLDHR